MGGKKATFLEVRSMWILRGMHGFKNGREGPITLLTPGLLNSPGDLPSLMLGMVPLFPILSYTSIA